MEASTAPAATQSSASGNGSDNPNPADSERSQPDTGRLEDAEARAKALEEELSKNGGVAKGFKSDASKLDLESFLRHRKRSREDLRLQDETSADAIASTFLPAC